jgi:hypothetical protein
VEGRQGIRARRRPVGQPLGPGRPGWHIECSAMVCATLGETFDIHGGGADLQFPHHENEIAQSEGANGKPLARFWMHNGFVRVDNEKMSKSLGNFFTIRDVLKKYDAETVRFFLVRAHYRSALNYSDVHLDDARNALQAPVHRAGRGGAGPAGDRLEPAFCGALQGRDGRTTSARPRRWPCCSNWPARSTDSKSAQVGRACSRRWAACLGCCRATPAPSCRPAGALDEAGIQHVMR